MSVLPFLSRVKDRFCDLFYIILYYIIFKVNERRLYERCWKEQWIQHVWMILLLVHFPHQFNGVFFLELTGDYYGRDLTTCSDNLHFLHIWWGHLRELVKLSYKPFKKISASEILMTLMNSFLSSSDTSLCWRVEASLFCLDSLAAALVEVNVRSCLWQQTLSTTEEEVVRLWSVLESRLKRRYQISTQTPHRWKFVHEESAVLPLSFLSTRIQ